MLYNRPCFCWKNNQQIWNDKKLWWEDKAETTHKQQTFIQHNNITNNSNLFGEKFPFFDL